MCRSIKMLRSPSGEQVSEPSEIEIREAALQYVRKISGYRKPSQVNTLAFESAIDEVAAASQKLLLSLQPGRRPLAASRLNS